MYAARLPGTKERPKRASKCSKCKRLNYPYITYGPLYVMGKRHKAQDVTKRCELCGHESVEAHLIGWKIVFDKE